jgi:hypothetical protein
MVKRSPRIFIIFETEQVGLAVTLWNFILEMLGSNLDHRLFNFLWFSVLVGKCGSISIRPRPLAYRSFPIHYSSLILPFDAIPSRYLSRCKITPPPHPKSSFRRPLVPLQNDTTLNDLSSNNCYILCSTFTAWYVLVEIYPPFLSLPYSVLSDMFKSPASNADEERPME